MVTLWMGFLSENLYASRGISFLHEAITVNEMLRDDLIRYHILNGDS